MDFVPTDAAMILTLLLAGVMVGAVFYILAMSGHSQAHGVANSSLKHHHKT